MASDKKISQLPDSTGINTSDISVLVDVDTSYQFSFSQLLTYLGANLTFEDIITFGTGSIPANTVGKDGDVYVKTDTGQFAQKGSGVWTVVYTVVSGIVGSTIYYGSGTPASGTGINGDTYLQTIGGIFYQKVSGVWVTQFSMATGPVGATGAAGANGTNGADGNTILYGAGNPSNSMTGVNGNFYINTSTYYLFGPKTAGNWGSGVSIIGPTYTPPTPEINTIASATSLTSGYVSIDYTPYATFGNTPTIIVQQVESSTVFTDIYDVPVKRIFVSSVLTTLHVFAHSLDGTTTSDTIQLIIKV